MLFDLAHDLSAAAAAIPAGHRRREVLTLLAEAVRRDIHFLDRHPTTLFQCLWNSGWWHDCAEAGAHYLETATAPPSAAGPLSELLEAWRRERAAGSCRPWARALRPGPACLGAGTNAVLTGHAGPVLCVAVSPDGAVIASGSADQSVRIWAADDGRPLGTFPDHPGPVTAVAFSPDGKLLTAGCGDGSLWLWAWEQGETTARERPHQKKVVYAAFTPDGCRVTASLDGTVRLRDPELNAEINAWEAHTKPIVSAALSADGERLVTSGLDGACRIWATYGAGRVAEVKSSIPMTSLAIDPAGRYFAGTEYFAAYMTTLYDLRTGTNVKLLATHDIARRSESAAFAPDGRQLAVAADNGVRLYDVERGRLERTLAGHDGLVTSVAYHPRGDRLITGSQDQTVRLWDLADRTVRPTRTLLGHGVEDRQNRGFIAALDVSPDGRFVATGGSDSNVIVWDARTGRRRHDLGGHWQYFSEICVNAVAFSPTGQWLASADGTGVIRVRRVDAVDQVLSWQGHTGEKGVRCLAWFPDENRFATGGYDTEIWLWELGSKEATGKLLGHTSDVTAVAAFPDGRRLASGSRDGTLRIWNAESGRELTRFDRLPGVLRDLRVLADDRLAVEFEAGGGAILSPTGEPIREWDGRTDLGRVLGSNEDELLAVSSGRETVTRIGLTGTDVGWHPVPLRLLRKSALGDVWAGARGNHWYLLDLSDRS